MQAILSRYFFVLDDMRIVIVIAQIGRYSVLYRNTKISKEHSISYISYYLYSNIPRIFFRLYNFALLLSI